MSTFTSKIIPKVPVSRTWRKTSPKIDFILKNDGCWPAVQKVINVFIPFVRAYWKMIFPIYLMKSLSQRFIKHFLNQTVEAWLIWKYLIACCFYLFKVKKNFTIIGKNHIQIFNFNINLYFSVFSFYSNNNRMFYGSFTQVSYWR